MNQEKQTIQKQLTKAVHGLLLQIHNVLKPLVKAVREFLYIQKFDYSVYKKSRNSQNTASIIFEFGIEIYNIFKFSSHVTYSLVFSPMVYDHPFYYLKTPLRYISTGTYAPVLKVVAE